jgi:hypothetical protein
VRSWKVRPVEAQDLGHCLRWTCLWMMKVGLGMTEAGMRAKEGLVCRGRVSLVIGHLGSELSSAAFVGRTVALDLTEHLDGRPMARPLTPGY